MSNDKQVLVVDQANGALSGVMEELDELGFRVIWVPKLTTALEFIRACPKLALIIASAAATRVGGLDFLAQIKEFAPDVRIIWGAHPDQPSALATSPIRQGLDSLIPEPFRSDDLRNAISELLAEHFYPPAIADAIRAAALEVLGAIGQFRVEGGAFLVANQTALSDLSAVMPFTGRVSGHLMVGMKSEHAKIVYQAFIPSVRSVSVERMEDLVGELCNQILGRINSFFVQRGVGVQHGTPIFIRASGRTLRYPGRQPSFAVTMVKDEVRISLEYYLADFDRAKLESPVVTRVLPVGEVRYL